MITSSSDIYRSLAGDALISAIAKVRIIDGAPSLRPEDGTIIYVSKYPKDSEFEATWFLWIIDFDNEPLDVVISQIRKLFPGFEVLEDGAILKGALREIKTTRTELAPVKPQAISIEPYLEALNEKFEELRESIEDRMLLVNSGRPGRDGKDGKDGSPGRDGRDGRDLVATEANLNDLNDVFVDDAKKGQVLTYDGDTWVSKFVEQSLGGGGGGLSQSELNILQGIKEGGEPMGFVDRFASAITFDDASRTLTISPVADDFVVWVKSKRFIIKQPLSVQIPDTTGLYFVFFDTEGNLAYQTDYFYWDSEAPTAYVYWDADLNTCPYLADERHGIVLDWQTHEYLHRTRGSAFANGFAISNFVINGDSALDSSAQFDLNGGTFFDEDLQIDITHSATPDPALFQQDLQGPARCGVFYKVGTVWKFDAATDFAFKMGPTRPYYNSHTGGTGSLTESSNNRFVNYYIVATHNLKAPIVSLMGQAQYVNITDAQNEDFGSLGLVGFPSKEFRFLYKIIFKTGNFANSVDCVIAGVQDLRSYSEKFVAALDVGSIRIDQLDAPITSVSFNDQNIINLADPIDPQDAVTKNYVDGNFQPLDSDLTAIATLVDITQTEDLGLIEPGDPVVALEDYNGIASTATLFDDYITLLGGSLRKNEQGQWIFDDRILAQLGSPNFYGIPTAPTAPIGSSTQQIANTEFVANTFGDLQATVTALTNRLNAFRDSRCIYVGKNGNDENDGTSIGEPLLTLNAAAEVAEPGDVVFVAPGTYAETLLPIRWKRDVSVLGAGLRNTIVQPAAGQEYNDIFRVDSGFWCWGLSFAGHQSDESIGLQSWAIAFDEEADNTDVGAIGPGAFILKSPYIQNCTSITAEDDAGNAGSRSTGDTGGGINVDGSKCALNSPIRSMVVDSYTQVNLGGPGCLVQNDGYAQLVSFFGTFCTYHVRTETGGQVNLSGGGTTDFGIYGLMADGYSPTPLYTAEARVGAFGAARIERSVTIDVSTAVFTATDHGFSIDDQVTFTVSNGTLPTGIDVGTIYYVISSGFGADEFKVSESQGGSSISLSGTATGTYAVIRQGVLELDLVDFSPNRLGLQIKYPTTGSLGSPGNPVSVSAVSGNQLTVTLGTSTIKHQYVGGGIVTYAGNDYAVLAVNYDNTTGITVVTVDDYTPQIGHSVTLAGLSFICDSTSRPNAGQLMFPQLVFPRNVNTQAPEAKTFTYTRVNNYTLTVTEASSPSGPDHEYVSGGTVIIGGTDYGVQSAEYNKLTGVVTVVTTLQLPVGNGNVTLGGFNFICPTSAYIVTSSIPIDASGAPVDNSDPTRAGYRVLFYNNLNGGLINTVNAGQILDFRNRSQVSAPSHTFEFVGSGTNYDALPWNGGVPNQANAIIETNNGRVYSSNTNEKGDFAVGSQFAVDGTTGSVTINTDQFNLSGLNFIGPFSRNGGFSTVGVQLREISNNTALIASTGAADGNTAPTQFAVKQYTGSRYMTNVTATSGQPISVTGSAQTDGVGNWSFIRNVELSMNQANGLLRLGNDGFISDVFLSASGVDAGTYRSVTVDLKGRVTAGTNPTTFAGYGIADNSANLAAAIADETGTGSLVFANSPALAGTPTAPTAGSNANNTQIATTSFVQTVAQVFAQGLSIKSACRVATTANITRSGLLTIDGITLVAGNRVLVKNQSIGSENGIYVAASGAWTRASDFDDSGDVTSGAFTFIEDGTVNSDSGWVLTTAAPITLGTTALAFTQFSGAGQIIAGDGLTKSGNQLDVVTSSSARIVVNSDNIDLATTGINAGTYDVLTVDAYGRATAGDQLTAGSGLSRSGNTFNVGTANSGRIVVNADNIDLASSGVTAGTYEKVTVDTYGRVTAGTNPSEAPLFRVNRSGSVTLSGGTESKIFFNQASLNVASAFDVVNGIFQPGVAGYYQITFTVKVSTVAITSATVTIKKNASIVSYAYMPTSNQLISQPLVSDVIYLNGTTDFVEFFAATPANTGSSTVEVTSTATYATGHLVSRA